MINSISIEWNVDKQCWRFFDDNNIPLSFVGDQELLARGPNGERANLHNMD